MTRFEGHQRSINKPAELVYNYLSDFNNFEHSIPKDQVENWQSTQDSCSFNLKGIGEVAMEIVERQPNKLVKLSNAGSSKFSFNFWIQLKQTGPDDTRLKLTMDVELNAMMKMVAKKPLTKFITTLTDQIADVFNKQ